MHGDFSWPVKFWAPGIDISCMKEEGKFKIKLPHDLDSDQIWFRIYNEDGVSTMQSFLVGSLPETIEAEPNETPDSPQDLTKSHPRPNDANLTINGTLQKDHDVDCFGFELVKGQTIVAAVAANSAFGSPMDAIIQIVDRQGIVHAENHDDVGLDPRLAFTAPKSGQYIARLFAFPAKPDSTIRFRGGKSYVYRLTLTTKPFITHAVPLSATLGTSSSHDVRGWNIPANTQLPLRSWDDRILRSSLRSNTSLLRAAGWSGNAIVEIFDFETLPYESVTTKTNPLPITPPVSITGCINEPKQTDYFTVALQKNRPYTFRIESVSLHSHLVPHVRLTDVQGKLMTQSPVSANATDVVIHHAAKADGQYHLTVTDRYSHGGPRYYYRLTAEPTRSDFSLSVEADQFTANLGEALEIPVAIARVSGEPKKIETIEIEAIDLPDGVTCEPVSSEPSGDTSEKVTLKLNCNSEYSGPIRIRGTSSGEQVRHALSPLVHHHRFEQIWLIAKKAPPEKTEDDK